MPIRPPDQVITHRIELGKRDREILESVVAAYSFNRVTTPIVSGMSDVSFMVVLASLLSFAFPEIVIPRGIEQVDDVVDAIVNGIKENRKRNPENTFDITDRGFWQYLFEEGTIVGRLFT